MSAFLSTDKPTGTKSLDRQLSTDCPQGRGMLVTLRAAHPWLLGSLSGVLAFARPRHPWLRIVLLDLLQQGLEGRLDVRVQLHPVLDLLTGMHDRGVIPSAELGPDLGCRVLGELPR